MGPTTVPAISLGLQRIAALLAALGNPHRAFRAVHVAGTNGKGSVCAALAAALSAGYPVTAINDDDVVDNTSVTTMMTTTSTTAHLRVARFTSPHLLTPRDCIWIEGATISSEMYADVSARVKAADARASIGASPFELLFATAALAFKECQIHVAVVEVGLGGRLDATNVFDFPENPPICCVITSISMDHMDFLGETVELIAAEKAAIMRPGVPVVIGHQPFAGAEAVLLSHAASLGCEVRRPTPLEETSFIPFEARGTLFDETVCIKMPFNGSHQLENIGTVLAAVDAVATRLPPPFLLSSHRVLEAISAAKWPGRLEWVRVRGLSALIDGAHNEDSARRLREYVDRLLLPVHPRHEHISENTPNTLSRSYTRVVWIFGIKDGKRVNRVVEELVRPGDSVKLVPFSLPEDMPWVRPTPVGVVKTATESVLSAGKGLSESSGPVGHDRTSSSVVRTFVSIEEAIDDTLLEVAAAPGTLPIICGSLYLMSDVYRLLVAQ
ncbi:folylpolyglutamate synthase [Cladochytrium tenue]|nr:folylpolyglutamate synthase [Cladochytrium tenue]